MVLMKKKSGDSEEYWCQNHKIGIRKRNTNPGDGAKPKAKFLRKKRLAK